eukprot:TRINITY_DN30678_c0_g1_i1.p1 TRINITY_DN30678_c0_g1~~TRINITY_DN30678_c0_g1_i1.p1  ORF type:complete len:1122 (+),score=255.22 TRINITY_DN30678_c0_g1_i1:56-3367(+)
MEGPSHPGATMDDLARLPDVSGDAGSMLLPIPTAASEAESQKAFNPLEASTFPLNKVILTSEEEEGYRRFFGQLDTEMDGTIPVEDLVSACHLLDMKMPRESIEARFREVDNGDGRVELDEFIEFMSWAKAQGVVVFSSQRLTWAISKVLTQRLLNDENQIARRNLVRGLGAGTGCLNIHFIWSVDALVCLACLYYGIVVPMFVAMVRGEDMWWWYDGGLLLWAEICSSVLAVVDIYMTFRKSTRRSRHGELTTPLQRYFQSNRSKVDVLCAVPLDLVGYAAGAPTVHRIGYYLRLCWVGKINSLFAFSASGSVVTTTSSRWVFEAVPILRVFVWTVLVINLASCLFIVAVDQDKKDLELKSQYLEAVYWSLYTMSTVGYGDIAVPTDEAKVLGCAMFFASICINGYFVGKITSLMMVDTSGEHREMMAKTRQILSQFRIPDDVREDVLSFQNHLLSMKLSLSSFRDVIGTLPREVQESLGLYIRVQQLMQVPLFETVSAPCQVALAECLQSRVVTRGEYIAVEGDCATCMNFIAYGFAEVLRGGKQVSVVSRGFFFGECPLLGASTAYSASVRTLAYTELLELSKADFDVITGRFPTLKWHIEVQVARERGEPLPVLKISDADDLGNIDEAIARRLLRKRNSIQTEMRNMQRGMQPMPLTSRDGLQEGPVRFYGFAGEWGELCSFWPSPFTARSQTWPSLEHFFQAMKFEGTPHEATVRAAVTPEEARFLGKDPAAAIRSDWNKQRVNVMFEGICAKYDQCLDCRDVLLKTGNRKLVFADSSDDYWGIGPTGTGHNMYGALLAVVRDELQQRAQDADTVRFNGFTADWGRLASFFPAPFEVDEKKYSTLEHFFQAMKWKGTDREGEIQHCATPDAAHRLGTMRVEGAAPRSDWGDIRVDVMLQGLRAKFQQVTTCREELLRTGDMRIVFANEDPFWGEGADREGQNELGALLMQVRDELQQGDTEDSKRSKTEDAESTLLSVDTQVRGSPTYPVPRLKRVRSQLPAQAATDGPRRSPRYPALTGDGSNTPGFERATSQPGDVTMAELSARLDDFSDMMLQVRETQLQQQEFIMEALSSLAANQKVIVGKLDRKQSHLGIRSV